jgi:hypothetical protein
MARREAGLRCAGSRLLAANCASLRASGRKQATDTHKCIAGRPNVRQHCLTLWQPTLSLATAENCDDGRKSAQQPAIEKLPQVVYKSLTKMGRLVRVALLGRPACAAPTPSFFFSPDTGFFFSPEAGRTTAAAPATFYNRSNLLMFLWLRPLTVPYHGRTWKPSHSTARVET